MNIAVIYVGIVRPDRANFLENKKSLLDSLGENKKDVFLFSYEYGTTIEIKDNKDVDFCILEKEEDYDKLLSIHCSPINDFQTRRKNHYKMFIMSKKAIEYVNSLRNNYDYFVYSRPDLKVSFNAEAGWYDKNYLNIPSNGMNPEAYNSCAHDQFHIGTPSVMQKTWDYNNIDNLVSILPMDPSIYPEMALYKIMKVNGVEQSPRDMAHCELNRSLDIFKSY